MNSLQYSSNTCKLTLVYKYSISSLKWDGIKFGRLNLIPVLYCMQQFVNKLLFIEVQRKIPGHSNWIFWS